MSAYGISKNPFPIKLESFDIPLISLSILGNNYCITYVHLGINLADIDSIQNHSFLILYWFYVTLFIVGGFENILVSYVLARSFFKKIYVSYTCFLRFELDLLLFLIFLILLLSNNINDTTLLMLIFPYLLWIINICIYIY